MSLPQPECLIFNPGRWAFTPGAVAAIDTAEIDVSSVVARYLRCDWGDVTPAEKRMNDEAVQSGGYILASYEISTGVYLWIRTEVDRSCTTILLPSES